MGLRSIAAFFAQKRPLPVHRAYWQGVPLRRLTSLLIAIFCLFGMLGCFTDLLDQGRKPFLTVVCWSLWSGLVAVLWILAYFRDRRWLVAVVLFWALGSRMLSAAMHRLGPLPHPTPEYGTRVATIACMILSFAAYLFFMGFMQREGSRAVRMQTELALAQGIQTTLVPVIDSRIGRIEIYGISLPSAEVGGDLVDLVVLPDGSLFAYVADVSGHGLPAGILMGMIKTAVRTQLFDLPTPAAVFQRLNEVLPAVKEPHMYATCTALRIHRPSTSEGCRVEYAVAGQPAMLHASSDNSVIRLSDQQLPLGLLAGPPYTGHDVELQPGDVLLIATDGVLEASDESGAEFGLDQLERFLLEQRSQPLSYIVRSVHSALAASYVQDDDQSLLLVRLTS
ncbi:MAG TPA: PP2C family protein-serine/threonine phosphatase [Candidatus Eisenbacteria bacterium]|nr:PP2C family protein-serine/threonine phosphatase [Candidatus Eisenbacteria bacterium]